MFIKEFTALTEAAKSKEKLLKTNPLGFFTACLLAGMYVGVGVLLVYTIGGMFNGQPYVRFVMGLFFGVALSLVIMAGAELFTGNNMIMASSIFTGNTKLKDACKLWGICYVGNWIGAILLALLFFMGGLTEGNTGKIIATTAAVKMSIPFVPLVFRAILCNFLVCLAVWCSFRCQSDSGKLIMVFWCVFAFFTCGFEHSIANMTLLTLALLSPFGAAVSISGYFYNIIFVSLGNMFGGIFFISFTYFLISKKPVDTPLTNTDLT